MKITIGRGFLMALAALLVAEVATHLFYGDKIAGLSSFGYDSEAGYVDDEENGTVSFVRSWGRRFHPQTIQQVPDPEVCRIFVLGDSVPRGKGVEKSYTGMLAKNL
ncbi:MAG: hypothetical protein AAF357_15320, partial [Verrucomicrobiota bacterium]